MTAITEITRNGSRSARGLVSIQSRLNQVVDESSSTGKQLIELYKEQNIALFDQNGQLRDSYDILKDLAAVWPNLTRNQQAEFALAQAGANQTQNFTALMNNFQVAIDATATAMDSAGSAMKENTSYMESLEAQTTQLKATFQDFANNVIDKELVSSILTLANDALGALNTEGGKTITQWVLLTGVLTGGLTIYGQIASKLISAAKSGLTFASAITGAGTAASSAAVGFGTLATTALPIAAILAGVAIAGWEVYKWIKDTHKPLQEYTDEIQANTKQLETNRDRLAEIEQMSWDKKTPDILDEYDALVKQNDELQRNIELLEERRTKQAIRQARAGGEVETGGSYYTAVGFDDATQYKTAEDAYLSLASANYLVVESAEDAKQQLEAMGITLQENAEMVEVDADAYNNDLISSMLGYRAELGTQHGLNQEQLRDFNQLKTAVSERVEGLKQLESEGNTLTESERRLISVYDSLIETEAEAKNWTEKYGDALIITDSQAKQLLKTFPELKNQLVDTGSGWAVLNTNVQSAADGLISADGRIKASSKDRVKSVIEDIKTQVEAYKELYTITLYQPYSNTDPDYEEKKRKIGEAKKGYEASAAALVRLQQAVARTKTEGYYDDVSDIPTGTSTTKTKKDKATDLALKEFKNLQKDLEHQKELGLIKEEEYYDKLEQLVKDYKAKATAHMKEYGLTVNQINQNMYQYEEEIYKGRKKLADDFKEQQKKDAEEALEKQKEDFESAVDYVVKQIDKEIDALQKENNALEDQIKYEELLDNLAKAKQKKLFVFKDGRFQYIQDADAISSAQKELDAYEREKALDQEIKRLETLKEEWESVTTKYQEEQDKLLAEQILGIDTEKKNWDKRITNLSSFADKYSSILKQITLLQKQAFEDMLLQQEQYLSKLEQRERDKQTLLSGGSISFTGAGGQEGHIYLDHSSANKPTGYYDSKGNALTKGQVEDYVGTVGGKVYDSSGKSYDANTVKFNKHAEGTTSSPGGLSLVGENGPELRVLNSGDGIIPADATRNLWDWAKFSPKEFNGGTMIHIANLNLPNVRDGNDFVKYMVNNFWRETVQYAST